MVAIKINSGYPATAVVCECENSRISPVFYTSESSFGFLEEENLSQNSNISFSTSIYEIGSRRLH